MALLGHWRIATEPAAEPVTLDEAKDHCDIVDSNESDERIEDLIRRAREFVEKRTRRQLMAATWDLMIDGSFPSGERRVHGPRYAEIRIPRPPLRSVEYVKYVAPDGTLTTLATDQYTVDTHEEPGRIVPAYGLTWPSVRDVPQAVRVRFDCGFSDPEDTIEEQRAAVPELFKGAILMVVEHWNTNRGPVVTGTISTEVQKTLDSVLAAGMVKEAA